MTQRARLARLARFYVDVVGRRTLGLLIIAALMLSLIELGGIGLILPYIDFVVNGPARVDAGQGGWLSRVFQGMPHARTVVIVGCSLLVVLALKGWLHARLIRYQLDRVGDINARTADRFIDRALNARYSFFLDTGAVKVAGISYSNSIHASLLLQAAVSALNELVWLAFVAVALAVLFPLAFVILLAVTLLFVLRVAVPWSRHVASIGRRMQSLDLARHRFVFAMVSAVRDIKIMGLERLFIQRNRVVVRQHVDLSAEYAFISSAIRIGLEAVIAISLVAFCMWFGLSGRNLAEVAPLLAVGALVMARAAPSASRVMAAYNGFRYSLPFVESLLDVRADLDRYEQPTEESGCALPGELRVSELCFRYGDAPVLDRVSLVVPQGALVAVIGPSGSGKSTLLDCISGLLPAAEGRFSIDGRAFDPFLSRRFRERVGYVPQSITLLDASLAFNIALEETVDARRLERALRQAHLTDFVAGLPDGLDTMLGEGGVGVSGGQRQRIGIARALYREPALLILDEVTSALDELTEAAVMSELLELRGQTSMLLVTHRLPTVALADCVYRLDSGRAAVAYSLSDTAE